VPETSLNLLYLCVVTVNQVSSTTVVCFSDTCLHNKRSSSCCNHIYILYNILYMILNSYQSLSPTQISFYHCKHPCFRGSYNGTIWGTRKFSFDNCYLISIRFSTTLEDRCFNSHSRKIVLFLKLKYC